MPQYKLRPVVIKAQSIDSIIASEAATPKTHSARIAGLIANGSIVFQPSNQVAIKTPAGKVLAAAGQTLLQDMVGDLSVMLTAKFNALYQAE